MTLYADTRQKQNKHLLKHKHIENLGYKLVSKKLDVGDYMFENGTVSVDTKQDLLEVCGNLFHDKKRFIREINRAKESKIKLIILVEEDGISKLNEVRYWSNKNTSISGKELEKRMLFFRNKYNIRFEFCNKKDTGKRIIELLKRG